MERELNLSIIIPVYNGEKTICECLDSVLKCPYVIKERLKSILEEVEEN